MIETNILFKIIQLHKFTTFGKQVIYKENKPGEAEVTLCDDTLAKEILGWEPKLNIKDYICKK